MNHTLFFIRHGKLDLPYASHSEIPFEIMTQLGKGTLDPHLDQVFSRPLVRALLIHTPDLCQITTIYSSPYLRTQDTAKLFQEEIHKLTGETPPIIVDKDLREITFDLSELLKENASLISDTTTLNQVVFEGLVSGHCTESIDQAHARALRVLRCAQASSPALCITHDFFMRTIEYAARNLTQLHVPLLSEITTTQRNGYIQGFALDSSCKNMSPLGF